MYIRGECPFERTTDAVQLPNMVAAALCHAQVLIPASCKWSPSGYALTLINVLKVVAILTQ